MDTNVTMVRFQPKSPFKMAFGTLEFMDRVFVRLANGGLVGWGEAAIDFPFTAYDAYDIYTDLKEAASALEDGQTVAQTIPDVRWPAARAALDMAQLDLESQHRREGIAEYLRLPTGDGSAAGLVSIGISESPKDLIEPATATLKAGFIPKVKLGRGVDQDLSVVECLSSKLGAGAPIAFDANGAYDPRAAEKLLVGLSGMSCRVVFLEQPTNAKAGPEVLGHLAAQAPFPIVADESCTSDRDAARLAPLGVGLNLKLSKIGGPSACLSLIGRYAVPMMVGGTFGSELHRSFDQLVLRALSSPLPSDAMMPAGEYFSRPEYHICERRPMGWGIGIEVVESRLERLRIPFPRREYRGLRQSRGDYEHVTGRSWDWNL